MTTTPKEYDIIYMDPPKRFAINSNPNDARTSAAHYPTLDWDQLAAFDIGALANPRGGMLLLWSSDQDLLQSIHLMEAYGFTYWRISFVWAKRNKNEGPNRWALANRLVANQCQRDINDLLGHTIEHEWFITQGAAPRKSCEFLLQGWYDPVGKTTPAGLPDPPRFGPVDKAVKQLIVAPIRLGPDGSTHSVKPWEAYDRIARCWGPRRRLELFARPGDQTLDQHRVDWDLWGNEVESPIAVPLRAGWAYDAAGAPQRVPVWTPEEVS